MNDNGLDQLFGKAAAGGDFPMDQAHLDQALGMIQKEKRRRFFIWWWMGSAVVLAVALWMWSPWSETSLETPASSLMSEVYEPMDDAIEAYTKDEDLEKGPMEEVVEVLSVPSQPFKPSNGIQDNDRILAQAIKSQDVVDDSPELGVTLTEEVAQREFIEIKNLEKTSPGFVDMDLTALSKNEIYQTKRRLPLSWNAIFEVNNYDLNSTSAGFHGGRIGLSLIKPITPHVYLAIEPMLSWSTDFKEDHLLLETNDYGLEVSSRAFRIQPDLVINGQINLHLGWVSGRWKLQTGPSIHALPWAQGGVYELDADQRQWTDIAKVGSGRLESDLSDTWSWGWSGTALYHLTPKWHLGLSVNFQDRSFFQKDHFQGRSDRRLNIGLRTQYLLGS